MGRDIFVVEAITNGPDGYPRDQIVQIGIASIDLSKEEVESALFMTVKSDIDRWKERNRAYISEKISLEEIENGSSLSDVVTQVRLVLSGNDATSFEVSNTFNKYLIYEPWDVTHEVTIMPSIGARISGNLRGIDQSKENDYIDKTFLSMYPDDEYGISDGKTALDYALKASYILLKLKINGRY